MRTLDLTRNHAIINEFLYESPNLRRLVLNDNLVITDDAISRCPNLISLYDYNRNLEEDSYMEEVD